ncbi:hypothetical protein DFH06DRAFT_1159797 [Mycena polygramma]|nr:hypothetical protein DFH06DRAFT_1159797 [Mycena polygramma]
MASAPHPAADPTSSAVHANAGVVSSGMFAGAQHLVVTARKLKNLTKNYTVASEPSDFRMFPMGDIDLRREICLNKDTGVVSRGGWSNRRIYSAKLHGKDVTIAIYHDYGAAGEWRKYVKAHYLLRHPNIIQIYGTARLCGIHATILHGDLIPIQHCVDLYKHNNCSALSRQSPLTVKFDVF